MQFILLKEKKRNQPSMTTLIFMVGQLMCHIAKSSSMRTRSFEIHVDLTYSSRDRKVHEMLFRRRCCKMNKI